MRESKADHVWLKPACHVQTMLVCRAKQAVIAVDKLDIAAARHVRSTVTRHTYALIALPQIDDIVADIKQFVDGRLVASVVYDNNLTPFTAERQAAYAVDTAAKHRRFGVERRDNETDQRPVWCILWAKHHHF